MDNIYLDHNATTPILPEVFEAMKPYLTNEWGNASSIHFAGREPKRALDEARDKICELLNCSPIELIFTSTGSESDNLAIKGAYYAKRKKGNHIITTKVEHPAVLATCKYLAREGAEVTYLDVNPDGTLDLDTLRAAIRPETVLITVMYVNNETGVLFPVKEIAAIAKERKILFHTDAVQAIGKVPVDVKEIGCDLLTISGHKLYAPKGVGALYVKRGVRVVPIVHGGHQERNRRGGTENIAGIVAFAKAFEVTVGNMEADMERIKLLRDRLERELISCVPHARLNGHPTERTANTTNISFGYVEGESLLLSLDMLGVAASSGSACTSGSLEPSHVLSAMGVRDEFLHGSLRFSLGRGNTDKDVDFLIEQLPPIVERMRSMSPIWNEVEQKGIDLEYEEKSCS